MRGDATHLGRLRVTFQATRTSAYSDRNTVNKAIAYAPVKVSPIPFRGALPTSPAQGERIGMRVHL